MYGNLLTTVSKEDSHFRISLEKCVFSQVLNVLVHTHIVYVVANGTRLALEANVLSVSNLILLLVC